MTDFLADFMGGEDTPAEQPTQFAAEVTPGHYVRIQSTTGGVRDLPIDPTAATNGLPGVPLANLLVANGFNPGAGAEYWIDGTKVDGGTLVTEGQTVTIITNVKGG